MCKFWVLGVCALRLWNMAGWGLHRKSAPLNLYAWAELFEWQSYMVTPCMVFVWHWRLMRYVVWREDVMHLGLLCEQQHVVWATPDVCGRRRNGSAKKRHLSATMVCRLSYVEKEFSLHVERGTLFEHFFWTYETSRKQIIGQKKSEHFFKVQMMLQVPYAVFGDRTSFRAKGLRRTRANRNFTPVLSDRT